MKLAIVNLKQDPPVLPTWFHIVNTSLAGILDSLSYWDTRLSSRTTLGMLAHHKYDQDEKLSEDILPPGVSLKVPPGFKEPLDSNQRRALIALTAMAYKMSDEEVIVSLQGRVSKPCPGTGSPQKRKEWLDYAREMIIGAMMLQAEANGFSTSAPAEFDSEAMWYSEMRIFVPPPVLRARHEGLDDAWKSFRPEQKKWSSENVVQKVRCTLSPFALA